MIVCMCVCVCACACACAFVCVLKTPLSGVNVTTSINIASYDTQDQIINTYYLYGAGRWLPLLFQFHQVFITDTTIILQDDKSSVGH